MILLIRSIYYLIVKLGTLKKMLRLICQLTKECGDESIVLMKKIVNSYYFQRRDLYSNKYW